MNRVWIRRLALALAALLLLLVAAAVVLVATFDANRYKGLAIDWMKTERQRDLVIDGPIELSVFPRVALTVSDVRLSEARSAQEFLAVDKAALSLQILPLLRKQVVVDRISASGVRAVYARNAQGVRNIDDLLPRDSGAAAGAAPTGTTSAVAPALDVSAVQLERVQLRVRDEQAKFAGDIDLQSFTAGRLAAGLQTPLTWRATVNLSRPQPVKLALEGSGSMLFDPQTQSATFSDLQFDVRGDAAGLQALTMTVAARHARVGGQRLEFDALAVALAGRQGNHPFELSLDWPRLAADAQQLTGSGVSGRFKVTGAADLAGNFRSAAPSGNYEALRLPGVDVTLAGNVGARKVDGSAQADMLLQPAAVKVQLERLAVKAAVVETGLPPLRLALSGHAAADAGTASWTLDGTLNANRFNSKGSAAFAGAVPRLEVTARFDSLDLNKLLGGGSAPATAAAAPGDTPVKLDGLARVNGRFLLTAGALAFRQYRVADARVDAALDGGLLRVSRLAGKAWGGSIEGSGSAEARSQRIAVKLAASGVDVNALLQNVAGKDLLDGRGRVTADLTTQGASLGALRSNLAGSAALQLRDGAIKGINLARSLRQAKAALSLKQDAVAKARITEKTDFSELGISARIAAGVAHSDDLDVKSPFLRLGGSGTFDIGRGRIDYTARATVVGAPTGQEGRDLAALQGVTVPVHLSGPFGEIDWKIQWSGVVAKAIENKLKERLLEKLGGKPTQSAPGGASEPPAKPKDLLKDALKGLFK